jgi:hypothetical protein
LNRTETIFLKGVRQDLIAEKLRRAEGKNNYRAVLALIRPAKNEVGLIGLPAELCRGRFSLCAGHFLLDFLYFVPDLLRFSLQCRHVLPDARSSGFVPFDVEFLKILLKRLNQIKKFLVPVHRWFLSPSVV